MISAGTHPARAVPILDDKDGEVGCRFGESDKKGTPFVQVLCQIIRGPFAGQTIYWSGYFSGGATEYTIKALRAFGFTGDDLEKFPGQRPENEVAIVVEMEESRSGRSFPKVAWVNAPNRGFKIEKPIQGRDLSKFSAQFKASLKSAPAIKGTRAVLQEPSDETPGDVGGDNGGGYVGAPPDDDAPPRAASDDDIPF